MFSHLLSSFAIKAGSVKDGLVARPPLLLIGAGAIVVWAIAAAGASAFEELALVSVLLVLELFRQLTCRTKALPPVELKHGGPRAAAPNVRSFLEVQLRSACRRGDLSAAESLETRLRELSSEALPKECYWSLISACAKSVDFTRLLGWLEVLETAYPTQNEAGRVEQLKSMIVNYAKKERHGGCDGPT